MTAWELFWVLKLDDIGFALGIIAVISGILSMFLLIPLFAETDDELRSRVRRLLKVSVPTFILSFCAVTLLPSTKQAAALYVVPTLTCPENMDKMSVEAKELYGIVKEGLKQWAEKEVKK